MVVAAVVVSSWAAFGGGAPAAIAGDDDAATLFDATNASRHELAGVAGLVRVGELDAIATRHASAMATADRLFHNPRLGDEVPAWSIVAENVGVGMDVGRVHQAFLDSPLHRANVLDGRLTEIGIGTVGRADGAVWVVVVFRTPAAPGAPVAAIAAMPSPERARPAALPVRATPPPTRPVTARAPIDVVELVVIEARPATVPLALTPQRAYVAAATPIVSLPAPLLVSNEGPTTPPPAALAAGALWLAVAVSLLRRLQAV
jgi:hypothetical protein